MIILRRDVVHVMRDGLERLVGEQAAPFLSYLASGIGIHEGSIFRDSITSTGQEQRAALESLVHSAFEDTNLGLGKVKIRQIDFDKASASVAISNCFEALENGTSDDPNCMFTSGFLAGLFAEVLDKTVQARETKCMSQGQPECEFEISLADAEEQAIDAQTEKSESAAEPESKKESKKENVPTPTEKTVVQTKGQTAETPKPTTAAKDQPSQPKSQIQSQAEMEKGVETANRIEKRKQGFWEKHLKKK